MTASRLAAAVPARPEPAVAQRLREEPIVWVTTVRPDGRPHVVPTWFWWDGSAFLVFSKPHAVKVANLAAQPAVMLAFGDPAADFDVLLVEGEAAVLAASTAAVLPDALIAKYAAWLGAIGLGRDEYAATYSQPVRITPTRFLPWHGRTARRSVSPETTIGERRSAARSRRHGRRVGSALPQEPQSSASSVVPRPRSPRQDQGGGRIASFGVRSRPEKQRHDRQGRNVLPQRPHLASSGGGRARHGARYVRGPAPTSSSVHAGSRPAADGSAARSRDAEHVKHPSQWSLTDRR